MGKVEVQAYFQMLDSYISKFSLDVYRKIRSNEILDIKVNVGFRIVNINKKDKEIIGQIELAYDLSIEVNKESVAKIRLITNGLFKGNDVTEDKKFEEMLKMNGAPTLSNLARAHINATTSLSGMPPIIVPLINFAQFFENATKTDLKNEDK
ncbi:MAG: protein-export chaperone SecB [Lachnospiraceae bacterium]|nr:protein-export chaperone SecB [Lachnospiraceae bacterium]